MNKDQITLDFPSLLVRDSYIQALKEGFYRGAQPIKTADEIVEIENNYENYIASLNKPITGMISAPDGHQFPAAPYETLWMSEGETFIGEYSFRHSLTDFLMNVGGHRLWHTYVTSELGLCHLWDDAINQAGTRHEY